MQALDNPFRPALPPPVSFNDHMVMPSGELPRSAVAPIALVGCGLGGVSCGLMLRPSSHAWPVLTAVGLAGVLLGLALWGRRSWREPGRRETAQASAPPDAEAAAERRWPWWQPDSRRGMQQPSAGRWIATASRLDLGAGAESGAGAGAGAGSAGAAVCVPLYSLQLEAASSYGKLYGCAVGMGTPGVVCGVPATPRCATPAHTRAQGRHRGGGGGGASDGGGGAVSARCESPDATTDSIHGAACRPRPGSRGGVAPVELGLAAVSAAADPAEAGQGSAGEQPPFRPGGATATAAAAAQAAADIGGAPALQQPAPAAEAPQSGRSHGRGRRRLVLVVQPHVMLSELRSEGAEVRTEGVGPADEPRAAALEVPGAGAVSLSMRNSEL